MTSKGLYALAATNVPKLAGSIDATSQAVVASEIELTAGKLSRMALESKDTLPSADVPDLCCIVEGGCHQLITVCIETQAHNFCTVTAQIEYFLTSFDVPELRSVIH